jgi:nucleoside-diphosphate-sugar epimerase
VRQRVLITGSTGLVGSAVAASLERRGVVPVRFDLRETGAEHGDVREPSHLARAIDEVDGVIHLAAVSRVLWGERDPDSCWATNAGGTRNVLEAAAAAQRAPWVIFASSREVYGQPDVLPVTEDAPVRPVNIYGRSKAEGERLVECARRAGARACTIRLSNVFGSPTDHADRVVPAFVRAALAGGELRVDGADHAFDFTHIDDVARGIASLVARLSTGSTLPQPIHFVTGRLTTLDELASLAIVLAGTAATVRYAPPRTFDVARFHGDPNRALEVLDWRPTVTLRDGLARMIRAGRSMRDAATREAAR